MGHTAFIFMHILAILFGFVPLFVTVPLHIIYSCLHRRDKGSLEGYRGNDMKMYRQWKKGVEK